MTRPKRNDEVINLTKQKLLLALTEDDALKKLMQALLQEVLEAEMDEALLACKGGRSTSRLGYLKGTPIVGQSGVKSWLSISDWAYWTR